MADQPLQVVTTVPPIKPGERTSEYTVTKVVVVLSSIIAVLGTALTVISSVTSLIPESAQGLGHWLAIGGIAVAAMKAWAYEAQRAAIKIAALNNVDVTVLPKTPEAADAAAAELGK